MSTGDPTVNIATIKSALRAASPSTKRQVFEKFALAALGSIPWIGGFISAAASFGMKGEAAPGKANDLQTRWLEEHQRKIERLLGTMDDIAGRFESIGDQINDRIQSDKYLDIVRKAFRTWDAADTEEKRQYVSNLISNAAGTTLCSDDVLRLFIDWLSLYHEAHFAVIRQIYRKPRCTRRSIWHEINGALPREDSAEADLFKLLIRDLSTGGVVRQARRTNLSGQFLRKERQKRDDNLPYLESAFEDGKPYVLTELGRQFVHYTMNEVVPRITCAAEEYGDDEGEL